MKTDSNEVHDKLDVLQEELDRNYMEYVKRDFDMKLAHHTLIKPILEKRNRIINEGIENKQLVNFYSSAILNFEVAAEILPITDNAIQTDFIKALEVDYFPNYVCKVRMWLNENDFVGNDYLEKTVMLFDKDVETSNVIWKSNCKYPIFEFFESKNEDLEIFDILYEFYVNSIFYFTLER